MVDYFKFFAQLLCLQKRWLSARIAVLFVRKTDNTVEEKYHSGEEVLFWPGIQPPADTIAEWKERQAAFK